MSDIWQFVVAIAIPSCLATWLVNELIAYRAQRRKQRRKTAEPVTVERRKAGDRRK